MTWLHKIWTAIWRWMNPYTADADEMGRRVSHLEDVVTEISERFGNG